VDILCFNKTAKGLVNVIDSLLFTFMVLHLLM